MKFEIRWERRALEEMMRLGSHHRRRVFDEVSVHLSREPTKGAGRRKWIDGLVPPWAECAGFWQLSVDPFRVFYDVIDEQEVVVVRAVRRKGRRRTEEIIK